MEFWKYGMMVTRSQERSYKRRQQNRIFFLSVCVYVYEREREKGEEDHLLCINACVTLISDISNMITVFDILIT